MAHRCQCNGFSLRAELSFSRPVIGMPRSTIHNSSPPAKPTLEKLWEHRDRGVTVHFLRHMTVNELLALILGLILAALVILISCGAARPAGH